MFVLLLRLRQHATCNPAESADPPHHSTKHPQPLTTHGPQPTPPLMTNPRPSDDPFDPDCEDTATSSGGSGSTTSRSSSASGAAPHLQQECSSPSPSLTPAAGNTTSSASTSDANSSHQADRQMAFDSASEFEFPFDCVTASSDDSSEEEASLAFGGFAYGSFASVVQASPCHDDGSAFGGFQGFRTPAGAEASQFELAAGSPWSLAPCPAPSPYPAVA